VANIRKQIVGFKASGLALFASRLSWLRISWISRRRYLRHEKEALELCEVIVLGLSRAWKRGFDLLEYAEDAPSNLADHAVTTWRRGRRLPREFVEEFTPKWDWLAA
jgi:hypothetical protein